MIGKSLLESAQFEPYLSWPLADTHRAVLPQGGRGFMVSLHGSHVPGESTHGQSYTERVVGRVDCSSARSCVLPRARIDRAPSSVRLPVARAYQFFNITELFHVFNR